MTGRRFLPEPDELPLRGICPTRSDNPNKPRRVSEHIVNIDCGLSVLSRPQRCLTYLPVSMHRCLSIHEIVRLIASELMPIRTTRITRITRTARARRATVVALACCCKSFEGPVLDVLWATQGGLMPLLKTLPGDIWRPGGYRVSRVTITLFIYLPSFVLPYSPFGDPRPHRNGHTYENTPEGYRG